MQGVAPNDLFQKKMIARVASQTSIPLIVGGGITDPERAYLNCKAGADVIVVGNAIEKDPQLIKWRQRYIKPYLLPKAGCFNM